MLFSSNNADVAEELPSHMFDRVFCNWRSKTLNQLKIKQTRNLKEFYNELMTAPELLTYLYNSKEPQTCTLTAEVGF